MKLNCRDKQKGWEVHGVEINNQAAKLGREKAGLDIFAGDLLKIKYKSDYFDYVRSNHSFEHIPNPNEVLAEVYRILSPDGRVFIGVPNVDGIFAKIFSKYWYHLGAPVHIFNYSAKTLKLFLEKHGFKIESIKYNGSFYGLLGSFQVFLNRKTIKPVEKSRLIHNRILIILAHFIAKLLNFCHCGDCIEIIARKQR